MQKTQYITAQVAVLVFLVVGSTKLQAQVDKFLQQGEVHGNFQAEAQYYNEDTIIGAADVPEQTLMNGFLNLNYTVGGFSAGLRYESYQNALLGFPTGYRGNGIPYRYASYTDDKMTITVGNFYEQFGSGMILRAYEERGLGYDNAIDGIRVKYNIGKGIYLKGLIGQQRLFFELAEGIVRGIDGEFIINDIVPELENSKTRVTLGASFVSKYQPDQNSQLVLPENVGTGGGRLSLTRGKVTLSGEYVYKINDPSFDNSYIYKGGEALLVEAAYSQKGFGLLLSAKTVDNMSFRSDRDEALTNVLINYLPALTRQHTYNLLATLYPYATQPNGEVAFQGDLTYKFKKKTLLGGKYGTFVSVNASMVNNIDTTQISNPTDVDLENDPDRQGYKTNFFALGEEVYWRELNIEVTKKFSKKLKGIFNYSNLVYNQDIIEGKPGNPIVYADVAVADITYKFNSKNSLRTEIQGLWTDQDKGDWATLLLEYSYAPHWFFAVLDQYNYGNKDSKKQLHFYNVSTGYNDRGTRIMLSYGRQRAGIFCVGGVCRVVPASNGLYLSVTRTF